MSRTFDPEIARLIDRYHSGEMGEDEAQTFLNAFHEQPELSQYVYEQLYVNFLIERYFESENALQFYIKVDRITHPHEYSSSASSARRNPETLRKIERQEKALMQIRRQRTLAVLVSFFLLVGFFVYRHFDSREETTGTASMNEPKPIAVVSSSIDAIWKNGKTPPMPGETIYAGNLELQDGMVEVLFFNGTSLIMEGPTDLSFLSSNQVFSREGRLSLNVPPTGHGFQVQTPHGIVTDFGTEFLLEIGSKQTAAHVVQGEVGFKPNDSQERMLKLSESFRATADGQSQTIAWNIANFVSTRIFQERCDSNPGNKKLRDAAWKRLDAEEPLFLEFPKTKSMPSNVQRFGGEFVPGRRETHLSVRFHQRSDQVQWTLNRRFDSITLSAWVRLEKLSPDGNPILASQGNKRGDLLWQITPSGALSLAIREKTGQFSTLYDSPIVMTPDRFNQWVHFITVVDTSQKRLVHYMNNNIIARHSLKAIIPIELKTVDVGNRSVGKAMGNLPGSIDSIRLDALPLQIFEPAVSYDQTVYQQK